MNDKKGFGLRSLILGIIGIALFALLLIWLFRNYSPNMNPFYSNVFRENISYMKDAAKSYFTNDKLPTEVGKTVKLTLKEMEEMNLLIPFVDKNGDACDGTKSYAQITKEENGWTLKVSLTCGKESDYVIEILGCHEYCEDCDGVALEYEFKRDVTKNVTSWSCPSGYTRNNKICTKKTGTETIAATKHYTKEEIKKFDILYRKGEDQTVEVPVVTKTETTTTKKLVDTTVTVSYNKEYVSSIKDTTTKKEYTNPEKKTNTTCVDTKIKDPNCTVQCKWETGSDGIPREVCNTCGYVTHRTCTDTNVWYCPSGYAEEGSGSSLKCYKNVTKTTYSCPKGYTEEGSGSSLKCYKKVEVKSYSCAEGLIKEGEGANTKCYKEVKTTTTTYKCPSDSTSNNGKTGADLKCYKKVEGEKIPYCENPEAKIVGNKCVLTIPSVFSHYTCKSGYTLDSNKGTCSRDIIDTVNATSKTTSKTITETKWSTSKILDGWTPTGRSRTVSSK